MGPIPKKSDFPAQLTLEIIPPKAGGSSPARSTNVLIILHGLGDAHIPYTSFASAMNLPETTCLVIRGPVPMPFDLPGYHWGDDLMLDSNTGLPDADPGFEKSMNTIAQSVIIDTLVTKLGYKLREILLFGLGQGGSVACSVALEVEKRVALMGKENRDGSAEKAIPEQREAELGGVVSMGAVLPLSASQPNSPLSGKAKTAILLVGGSGSGSALSDSSEIKRTEETFNAVQVVRWRNRKSDGMPTNREEMLPIMQFFARRLRSRHGVPEGSVEIA